MRQLRDEIAALENFYDETLGRRLAELDRIEAETCSLRGAFEPEAMSDHRRDDRCHEPAAPDRKWQSDSTDIKSLYREVARNIHPDLAGARSGTLDRHELMSRANRAYAEADRRTLQEILRKWWLARADWDDDWEDLVETRRLVARELQAISAVEAEVEGLRGSLAFRLKHRIDCGPVGSDLLADMVTAVDLNIDRARKRLARLNGEKDQGKAAAAAARGCDAWSRVVNFPEELSCGIVYVRDRNSSNFSNWKTVGPATGAYRVAPDKALRLDLRGAAQSARHLRKLNPHDLQALFLYDISDADLDGIVHLAGLEELYLSGVRLTDAALVAISSLKGLKRLYIYQTGISDRGLAYLEELPALAGLTISGNRITDEGLAGFQRVAPRVKTVSFQWRR